MLQRSHAQPPSSARRRAPTPRVAEATDGRNRAATGSTRRGGPRAWPCVGRSNWHSLSNSDAGVCGCGGSRAVRSGRRQGGGCQWRPRDRGGHCRHGERAHSSEHRTCSHRRRPWGAAGQSPAARGRGKVLTQGRKRERPSRQALRARSARARFFRDSASRPSSSSRTLYMLYTVVSTIEPYSCVAYVCNRRRGSYRAALVIFIRSAARVRNFPGSTRSGRYGTSSVTRSERRTAPTRRSVARQQAWCVRRRRRHWLVRHQDAGGVVHADE